MRKETFIALSPQIKALYQPEVLPGTMGIYSLHYGRPLAIYLENGVFYVYHENVEELDISKKAAADALYLAHSNRIQATDAAFAAQVFAKLKAVMRDETVVQLIYNALDFPTTQLLRLDIVDKYFIECTILDWQYKAAIDALIDDN
jgi:hypothetical protein